MRVDIAPKSEFPNTRGLAAKRTIEHALGISVEDVLHARSYVEDLGITRDAFDSVAQSVLANPVVETTSEKFSPERFDWVVAVRYQPGVKDAEGDVAKEALGDALDSRFPFDDRVESEDLYFLNDPNISREDVERIARLFANPTVQEFAIMDANDWASYDRTSPHVIDLPDRPMVSTVPDIREHALSLHLNDREADVIEEYFARPDFIAQRAALGLQGPTDAEIELLGQAWSEHCKHKIFNALIRFRSGGKEHTIDSIFDTFIKNSTNMLAQDRPWIVSTLWDNSGVVDFGGNHYLCFKVETHNSPSAKEPYGGAYTGIVGVMRDPMGTGQGADVIAGLYSYCTAPPFYDGEFQAFLHPDVVLTGVHHGVRDGGNRHGVPTVSGQIFFDEGYLPKPCIFVGQVGRIPKTGGHQPSYEKHIDPGDLIVTIGGRTGRDGLHGATDSSAEMSEKISAGHVQIGDAFTQKKVQELVNEARELGLYNYIQDYGAGGHGSAIGEMAEVSGGATLKLDQDLLKYPGLTAWEILESESQERMGLAVPPENISKLEELARKHDVDLRVMGEFNDSGKFHVMYDNETAVFLDIDFLHKGVPQMELDATWISAENRGLVEPKLDSVKNHTETLLQILGRENVASQEWIQREYDTRVKGRTVIPPLVGVNENVPNDASVMKIDNGSNEGFALGIAINPRLGVIDSYDMAVYVANEGVMRVVAAGANPDMIVNNDNFCWPSCEPGKNPEHEYVTAQLVRANRGLYDHAMAAGVASISGKDSMHVQGTVTNGEETKTVYALPTLQFATMGKVDDIRKAVTMDFKAEGDLIYLVGLPTRNELGGSEFYDMHGEVGRNVPRVNLKKAREVYRALHSAIEKELVESAHGCYKGGLAVALAQASFAGNVGVDVDLQQVPKVISPGQQVDEKILYSETATRFVVSVRPELARQFEQVVGSYAQQIGVTTAPEHHFRVTGTHGKRIIDASLSSSLAAWQEPFRHKMHEAT